MMRTGSHYHRHRFPAEIISHCVWLYFRFALSFRDVEKLLAMREWCLKFGQVAEQSAENSHQPTRIEGAGDEVQVSGPRAALSFGLRNHWLTLPSG